MTFGQRFLKFRSYTQLNQNEFAEKVGVSQGNLTHWENDYNRPNTIKINKIKSAFPELNINWLITGSGEMLNNDETLKKESLLIDGYKKQIKELQDKKKELEDRVQSLTDTLLNLYKQMLEQNKK